MGLHSISLQSRLGSEIVYSESFQIVKVSLDGNFALWNKDLDSSVRENIAQGSSEVVECIYV